MAAAGRAPSANSVRLAIDVLQQGLHQVGPLFDAGGDLRPLGLAEDQRQRVDRPAALVFLAVDPVGDAGVADVPGGEVEAALELALVVLGEVAQEAQPVVARADRSASISSSGTPVQGR